MKINKEENIIKKCIYCGCLQHKIIFHNPKNVIKCNNCELTSVFPLPNNKELDSYYSRSDLLENTGFAQWFKHSPKSLEKLWLNRIGEINKYKNGGKILDVGAGMGEFLFYANKNGWEVFGTEISLPQVKFAKDKFGINVFHGVLEKANFPANYFDVVNICHVLEHMNDPVSTLTEISRILKDNGLLIVEVPNLNMLFRRSYKVSFDEAQHAYHFSQDTLQRLIIKAGFKIRELKPADTGSLSPDPLARLCKLFLYCFAVIWFKFTKQNISESIRVICSK